ncbi:MAG TPA: hypothetical protein VJR89_25275 [Polyangiales bacterium]|nr:hypothetical protein [Polyangiales bacterium]
MQIRWLRAIGLAAALSWAASTGACLRLGYEVIDPPADSGPKRSGSGKGRDSGVASDAGASDAGQPQLEDAASTLPDAAQQPTDAGQPHVEDAASTLPDAATQPTDAGPPQVEDAATLADDAGTIDEDAGTSTRNCADGVAFADACWYLGASGASCTQVCATRGGNLNRATYTGTTAEGGSLSGCDAVLDRLIGAGDTMSGMRMDQKPLACHLYNGVRWWLASGPAYDATTSEPRAQLACSCNGL